MPNPVVAEPPSPQAAPCAPSKAGLRLRAMRVRLGLTIRNVEELSRELARKQGSDEFRMSHARLMQIENNESTPGIHKLFTLAAVYGVPITEILGLYLDFGAIQADQISLSSQTTRLVDDLPALAGHSIEFPLAFNDRAQAHQTTMLSELVKTWGHIPLAFLSRLNLRRCRYGLIGLRDYMMYPLLRPGSFVQIEEQHSLSPRKGALTEFDRPLYFIESHTGYLCCWCELHGDRLLAIPHPLSPCQAREFKCPTEAQIIGRVTAVAARLNSPGVPRHAKVPDADAG